MPRSRNNADMSEELEQPVEVSSNDTLLSIDEFLANEAAPRRLGAPAEAAFRVWARKRFTSRQSHSTWMNCWEQFLAFQPD